MAVAAGPQARLAPNTVGTYTKATGRARQQQEDALRVRPTPPSKAERCGMFDQPPVDRPGTAPDTLVMTMDGAIERTHRGWKTDRPRCAERRPSSRWRLPACRLSGEGEHRLQARLGQRQR